MNKNKIVIFSGSGISVASGLQTFRDIGGLWDQYDPGTMASIQAWRSCPDKVLQFYNVRRKAVGLAIPVKAHAAISRLEEKYEVIVVTQNVDDFHERAGSSCVIHLHGEIRKARSTLDEDDVMDIGFGTICTGDVCILGGQIRPHVVLFGEKPMHLELAAHHIRDAGRILAVGTSLDVEPAASLLKKARYHAEKILISYEVSKRPYGYNFRRGDAELLVPLVVSRWLNGETAL